MAVSRMNQIVLLVQKEYKTDVLKTIQSLESFEVIDEMQNENNIEYFQDAKCIHDNILKVQQRIDDIIKVQQILSEFVVTKERKKRYYYTYDELEKQAKQIDLSILSTTQSLVEKRVSLAKQLEQNHQEYTTLSKWKNVPFLNKKLNSMKTIFGVYGTLHQTKDLNYLMQLDNHAKLSYEILFQNDFEIGLVVYSEKQYEQECLDFLDTIHFNRFKYKYNLLPDEEILKNRDIRKTLLQKQEKVVENLKNISLSYQQLVILESFYQNKLSRLKAEQFSMSSLNVCTIKGYISVDNMADFTNALENNLPENSYVVITDLKDDQLEESKAPTQLKNNKWIEPFELLTEMYSLPKYNEIDPTPYMAPFYAVFFGMMVADVGYGLLMLLGTLYALKKMHLSKGMLKNIKLFHILSYPSILWGLFFGSFFSFTLPFQVMSTSTDVVSILVLSVAFGIFQLIFGLILNTKEQIKSQNYFNAFSDGIGWIGILIGIILMAIGSALGTEYASTLNEIAKWVIIINIVIIVLATMLGSKNKILGFGSGLYKLYGASSYIGDLASYTRLMALCVAGASIGSSFNLVISLLPPFARFSAGIVLFVVLQLLNLALSLLGAYVHAIRLQFVEFFGKFYEGGGRKFNPLKTYDKYIDLKENK